MIEAADSPSERWAGKAAIPHSGDRGAATPVLEIGDVRRGRHGTLATPRIVSGCPRAHAHRRRRGGTSPAIARPVER